MSTSNKIKFQELIWIVGGVAMFGSLIIVLLAEKSRQWRVDAVMGGPIRANKESRIYQVPTCPHYNSIHADKIRIFETIEEARTAGYRPAQNCGDDFEIRELNETGDGDGPDHPGDPQYR